MKLIIFSAHYLPHMGGVENFTYHLSSQLIHDGHQVTVVTTLEMNLPEHEMKENGLEIYRVPSVHVMNGDRYPIIKNWNRDTKNIFSKLSKVHYDLCLVNTRFYLLSLAGLRFGAENHIHTIVLDHGTSHLSVHNKVLDTLGAKWEHYLTDKGKKYHADYYGVSKASCDWLKHFDIQASGVIYNAIDLQEVENKKRKNVENYRDAYGIPDHATVITFTGRMLEEKGVPQLMECAEKTIKERNDVYFFFAGDGVLLKEMQQRTVNSKGHIICLGRIDSDHIISLLNVSNIFCLPSFSEGFSTSVLEAAACKAYIITTYRGGSRELIVSRKYGMIIPDNSVNNVEKALEYAIDHPDECKEASENCYTRLAENFTWKQSAETVERIMEKSNV